MTHELFVKRIDVAMFSIYMQKNAAREKACSVGFGRFRKDGSTAVYDTCRSLHMARTATTKRTAAPTARGRSTTATKPRGKAAAASKPTVAARRAAAAPPAAKVSKDELRAQVEKLERSVATLRAKNRELTRASKGGTTESEAPASKRGTKAETGAATKASTAPAASKSAAKSKATLTAGGVTM